MDYDITFCRKKDCKNSKRCKETKCLSKKNGRTKSGKEQYVVCAGR